MTIDVQCLATHVYTYIRPELFRIFFVTATNHYGLLLRLNAADIKCMFIKCKETDFYLETETRKVWNALIHIDNISYNQMK